MANDLQKGFHAARKLGDVAAINFLLENYEQNTRFAADHLARLCSEEMLTQAHASLAKAEQAVSDASWLWYAYQEFSRLSERQKTKQGGFKGFVRTRAGEDTALFGRVKCWCQRQRENDVVHGEAVIRDRLPNYKSHYGYCHGELTRHQTYCEVLRRGAAAPEQQAA